MCAASVAGGVRERGSRSRVSWAVGALRPTKHLGGISIVYMHRNIRTYVHVCNSFDLPWIISVRQNSFSYQR